MSSNSCLDAVKAKQVGSEQETRLTIQRTAQITMALLMVATFALSASNIESADDECEFGRVDPDNPLNTECRAVPESLGAVSVEFSVVPGYNARGTPICIQSNRFVFANERLNEDLSAEVEVAITYRDDLRYSMLAPTDNLSSHDFLGMWGQETAYAPTLKVWNISHLVESMPGIPSNAGHPFEDKTVTIAVVKPYQPNYPGYQKLRPTGEVVAYSDPIPSSAFDFNWRAALIACAQQGQQMAKEDEAKKAILLDRQASDAAISTQQFIADSEVRIAQAAIDHYTAEIGKLEAALAKLEATLTEARTLYEDALAKQRRTIELRTRMSQVMADYYADKEKAYLAFGAWADQQLAVQNSNLNDIELSTAKIEEVQSGYAELLEETNAKLEEARAKLEEASP